MVILTIIVKNKGSDNMIGERLLLKKTIDDFLEILNKFDKDRTIGSITRKELANILKPKIKEMMNQLKHFKSMGL